MPRPAELLRAFVGVLALLPVFLILHPAQRFGDRLAGKLLPATSDREKYLEFRRWEVYRATFEDVSKDGVVTEQERRTLQALAKSLGLASKDTSNIEATVNQERRGLPTRLPGA